MNSPMQPTLQHLRDDPRILKGLHFIIWAAIGLFNPYLNMYYRETGLSGMQIGLINTLAPLIGAVSATLWGMANDRFGRPQILLAAASAGSLLSALLLGTAHSFLPILVTAGILSLFSSPLLSMLNSITIYFLGENSADYGRYRLWGTLGFISTSLVSGFVFERIGLQAIFSAYAAGMGVFMLAAVLAPNRSGKISHYPLAQFSKMVRQPSWLIFSASMLVLGMATMGGIAFLPVRLRDMGGSEALIGMVVTVAALTEIPILLMSSNLLRKFGAARITTIGFFGYALRMALYAIMPVPGWALGINLLQGVSFGPYLVGTVAYANEQAPLNLKATAQGMLATVQSLSNVIGALAGGWLYDHTGPKNMYLVMAGACMFAWFIFKSRQFVRKKELTPA